MLFRCEGISAASGVAGIEMLPEPMIGILMLVGTPRVVMTESVLDLLITPPSETVPKGHGEVCTSVVGEANAGLKAIL